MTKQKFPSKEQATDLYKFYYTVKTKRNDETLKKADVNEPIFVLRAMDESAPLAVIDWIRENLFSASEDKLRSAFEQALAMKKFEDKRRAD